MATPTSVVTETTQTYASVTPAPIVGLLFAVATGVRYRFDFWVTLSSNDNSNGARLGLSFPAATMSCVHIELPNGIISNIVAINGIMSGTVLTSGVSLVCTGMTTGTNRHLGKVQGIIIPSASGNLQVTCGREAVTGALNIITVHPGSGGLLYELD